MKNVVRVLSLSLLLSGIGMFTMPTIAEAVCCYSGNNSCCGECCSADANGCKAGPCVIEQT